MPCPKCNSINLVKAGSYKIKRTNKPRERLRCENCNAHFVVRSEMFRKRIPITIRKKVKRLRRLKNPYKSRFDSTKRKGHSTRVIARKLGVSKSFVWEVIRKR